jgi:hypothetical protein
MPLSLLSAPIPIGPAFRADLDVDILQRPRGAAQGCACGGNGGQGNQTGKGGIQLTSFIR